MVGFARWPAPVHRFRFSLPLPSSPEGRPNTAPAQETNPPDFLAWHVANKGDKGFWTRIGAAWFHRDRKGLSLQLEVVPINGRIVLRTPLDDEKKEPGA